MKETIKPCPLCGDNRFSIEKTEEGWFLIRCEHCDTQSGGGHTEGSAIKRWNYRPIEDELKERIKELKELVEEIEDKLNICNFKNFEEASDYSKKIHNILEKEGE